MDNYEQFLAVTAGDQERYLGTSLHADGTIALQPTTVNQYEGSFMEEKRFCL